MMPWPSPGGSARTGMEPAETEQVFIPVQGSATSPAGAVPRGAAKGIKHPEQDPAGPSCLPEASAPTAESGSLARH